MNRWRLCLKEQLCAKMNIYQLVKTLAELEPAQQAIRYEKKHRIDCIEEGSAKQEPRTNAAGHPRGRQAPVREPRLRRRVTGSRCARSGGLQAESPLLLSQQGRVVPARAAQRARCLAVVHGCAEPAQGRRGRSEEHTSEL